jgi:lipopolysaccharide export LptBFGC system permease protein LptF
MGDGYESQHPKSPRGGEAIQEGQIGRSLLTQICVLSYIVAGIVMITLGSDGINIVVPAVVVSFIIALMDAWVLLVEINREVSPVI